MVGVHSPSISKVNRAAKASNRSSRNETDVFQHLSDTAKHWLDALSIGALVATLLDYLPGMTAALVFVWTAMRIFESYQAIILNNRKLRDK